MSVLISIRVAELYPCDAAITELCRLLREVSEDIVSFKRYKESENLESKLSNIAQKFYRYSKSVQYYFVQTLEYLFAFGYKNLGGMIYHLYQKLEDDSLYQMTALKVSKELSCVYVIDGDNEHTAAKKCRKIRKIIRRGEYSHLKGLCFYYIGLAEEFDRTLFKIDDVQEDCFLYGCDGYLSRSKSMGFLLAKNYIRHHRQTNFVTSQEYPEPDSYADYLEESGRQQSE